MEAADNYYGIKEEHVLNSNQEKLEAQFPLGVECDFLTRRDTVG